MAKRNSNLFRHTFKRNGTSVKITKAPKLKVGAFKAFNREVSALLRDTLVVKHGVWNYRHID